MQAEDIHPQLMVAPILKTREEYSASQSFFDSEYEIYEFNEWHQHITKMLQTTAELSNSDSLTLTALQKNSLLDFVKTGNNLLSTFTELKNYGSNHWLHAGGGLFNNGCLGGADISPRIIPKITELLKHMQNILKPASEADYRNALSDLNFQADRMAHGLTPSVSHKICVAVSLFVGAALTALGAFLIISTAAATGTPPVAIAVIGGFGIAEGALFLFNALSFFTQSYPKKISDFTVGLNKPATDQGLKEIHKYSTPRL